MKITPSSKSDLCRKELKHLEPLATFVREYHDLDAILKGTYGKRFSVYMVLPPSTYTAASVKFGSVMCINLRTGKLANIGDQTAVNPVVCELLFNKVF